MLLTEKEAWTKCCPVATNGVRDNERGELHIYCVTRSCMAWRWADDSYPLRRRTSIVENPTLTVEPERPAHVPASWEWCPYDPADGAPACWLEPKEEADKRRRGYCGLAGRPQS